MPDKSPVSKDVRDQAYYGGQEDAWVEFAMSGDSKALARYLEKGGEVTGAVREVLIQLLHSGPIKNPGGAKPWRDYETYCKVVSIKAGWGKPLRSKPISKRAACKAYAEKTHQELRTVELQYERGSRLFK